ncbi:MAG: TetR family transcriptional regulator [Alteromonadaceae bacterium]|nr:TetR family transcriptional regulator [Alteromonadaceae bacterium]MBH84393.1 TetR family transcriptional regulator [Alteromonadaceae bacterium]|tara:strand:+ start:69 stop:632 length:564 start_codon:yes stop_codon:yes gene_type:complete
MDKREQLVSVAFTLFYEHGVHAVGINRVLAESGIAKKTLYHHFESKDELVAATVDYRDQRFTAWLKSRIDAVTEGMEAIRAIFDALDDWFNGRDDQMQPFHGCFFINVSAEFGDPEHPIHQQCSRHKQAIMELIRYHASLVIAGDAAIQSASDTLAILKEGAIVHAHVLSDAEAASKAKAAAMRLLS